MSDLTSDSGKKASTRGCSAGSQGQACWSFSFCYQGFGHAELVVTTAQDLLDKALAEMPAVMPAEVQQLALAPQDGSQANPSVNTSEIWMRHKEKQRAKSKRVEPAMEPEAGPSNSSPRMPPPPPPTFVAKDSALHERLARQKEQDEAGSDKQAHREKALRQSPVHAVPVPAPIPVPAAHPTSILPVHPASIRPSGAAQPSATSALPLILPVPPPVPVPVPTPPQPSASSDDIQAFLAINASVPVRPSTSGAPKIEAATAASLMAIDTTWVQPIIPTIPNPAPAKRSRLASLLNTGQPLKRMAKGKKKQQPRDDSGSGEDFGQPEADEDEEDEDGKGETLDAALDSKTNSKSQPKKKRHQEKGGMLGDLGTGFPVSVPEKKAVNTWGQWEALSVGEKDGLIATASASIRTMFALECQKGKGHCGEFKPSHLRSYVRDIQTLCPEAACMTFAIAIEIHLNKTGNYICGYHVNHQTVNQTRQDGDEDALWGIMGQPQPFHIGATIAEAESLRRAPGFFHCGCDAGEVAFGFWVWKVWQATRLVGSEPEVWNNNFTGVFLGGTWVTEGLRSQRIVPRLRAFLYSEFLGRSGLTLADIYRVQRTPEQHERYMLEKQLTSLLERLNAASNHIETMGEPDPELEYVIVQKKDVITAED
ncbi:hypothetical protein B0H17DRAFT_1140261 [Mycena rosella]|uniref:Uncharacterized protein n=1 Tax=Mycena rosella TaxID=1033263 RepID=A0AAD7GC30_MYCRO|nr:hypothetical protein B0H17DRAFT_1140261 [Mycena rosella]